MHITCHDISLSLDYVISLSLNEELFSLISHHYAPCMSTRVQHFGWVICSGACVLLTYVYHIYVLLYSSRRMQQLPHDCKTLSFWYVYVYSNIHVITGWLNCPLGPLDDQLIQRALKFRFD
jgi:hypothetical protein